MLKPRLLGREAAIQGASLCELAFEPHSGEYAVLSLNRVIAEVHCQSRQQDLRGGRTTPASQFTGERHAGTESQSESGRQAENARVCRGGKVILMGHGSSVEAALKYLANDVDPVNYVASSGGGDATQHQGTYVLRDVRIHDGRQRSEGFQLDREGFALVAQASAVTDFYDDRQIAQVYEPEVRASIRAATGARRVEIFDHTRRAASRRIQQAQKVREPASIVHNDYTARSAPIRLRDHFADVPDEAERLLEGRFAIINLWRSITGPVLTAPLALCDATTIASRDLVSVRREAKDRIGEIQQAVYNPAHRWYYFPEMAPNEALLIKTYDSETDGRARFTIHTAFENPGAPEGAPARESLETRCFVFF